MKLSIITINYNNSAGLAATIQSVAGQTWKGFEFIIIDGGSTDASVEVIKQHENGISFWVSERDNGVYHAMNKGIQKATGEYLLMLNSGDCLMHPQTLYSVFQNTNYNEDILYGNVNWQKNDQLFTQSLFPSVLTFGFFWNKSLGHQAAFIKKSVHEVAGLYDESLRVLSDWKLFVLSICKYDKTYRHINDIIALCDCTGLSWNSDNFAFMKEEKKIVLLQYFPLFYNDYEQLEAYKQNTFSNKLKHAERNIKKTIKGVIRYKKKPE